MYAFWWAVTLLAGLVLVAMFIARPIGAGRSRGQLLVTLTLAMLPALLFTALAIGLSTRVADLLLVRAYLPAVCWLAGLLALSVPVLAWFGLRPLEDDAARVRSSRWPLGRLAVVLVALLVVHGLTFYFIDTQAQRRLAALRSEMSQLALSVAPPEIPEEENAASLYHAAYEAMGPAQELPEAWGDSWFEDSDKTINYDDPELRQFLQQQQPAIELARTAAGRRKCRFDRDYAHPSFDMLLPEVGEFRQLSWLLGLEARASAASGDFSLALTDVQAQLEAARAVGSEPILISSLVSAAVEEIAWQTLEEVLSAGNATSEELAKLTIESRDIHLQSMNKALIMEEAFGLSVFANLQNYETIKSMINLTPDDSSSLPGAGALYRVFLAERDLQSYRSLMRQTQRLAKFPYHQVKQERQSSEDDFSLQGRGMLTSMLFPAITNYADALARTDARRQTASAGLASARFRAAHDRWPTKLGELTPEFLNAIPTDPYTGQSIRMIERDGQLIFYSLGADLKDDQGKQLDQLGQTGDVAFTISVQQE